MIEKDLSRHLFFIRSLAGFRRDLAAFDSDHEYGVKSMRNETEDAAEKAVQDGLRSDSDPVNILPEPQNETDTRSWDEVNDKVAENIEEEEEDTVPEAEAENPLINRHTEPSSETVLEAFKEALKLKAKQDLLLLLYMNW